MRHRAIAKHFQSLLPLARSITAVCLIAFLTASASCLHLMSHAQMTCNHCTHSQPQAPQTPPCCSIGHHPPAVFALSDVHHPVQAVAFVAPLREFVQQTFTPAVSLLIESPPHPPRLTLRI